MNYEKRKGNGVRWKMETSHSISEGFTVDNLNVKKMSNAQNDFERLFITIRGVLEENEAHCMDDEEDRLQTCQDIASRIERGFKNIFKNKSKRH